MGEIKIRSLGSLAAYLGQLQRTSQQGDEVLNAIQEYLCYLCKKLNPVLAAISMTEGQQSKNFYALHAALMLCGMENGFFSRNDAGAEFFIVAERVAGIAGTILVKDAASSVGVEFDETDDDVQGVLARIRQEVTDSGMFGILANAVYAAICRRGTCTCQE